MWDSGAPFRDLVNTAREASGLTWRQLGERAIDPVTGHCLPHGNLWKIGQGQPVKIYPALVRAVAAAIEEPEEKVQIAAAQQYVGLVATSTSEASSTVVIAHAPGMGRDDMPRAQELLSRWADADGDGSPGVTPGS